MNVHAHPDSPAAERYRAEVWPAALGLDAQAGQGPAPAPGPDLQYFGGRTISDLTFANVYLGIAERALELAIESATTKSSVAIPRGTYGHNPMVQHQIAEMYLELDPARALVDRLIDDYANGVDHGAMWGVQIVSAKWRAVRRKSVFTI